MNDRNKELASREGIFSAIRDAAPTAKADVDTIQQEALAILEDSIDARPSLLADEAADAMVKRIEKGLVIGTSCQRIESLDELPGAVNTFLDQYGLDKALQVQKAPHLQDLNWQGMTTDVDIKNDNSVGLCWAEHGIAETGSFVVYSSPEMPVLLNFLPLYLIAVVPRSKILHYMDDYALIANALAAKGETPRNLCLISGVSGTTDIEGVLVQGAHGPEVLNLFIVENL
ncbi:LutC/YkgG family protein [Neptuniibacter sp. QD29_5]|uniref:LutC/YkgG family protein n=1 Tax=unclassified Neptuniibacter TaxID=2630693 RepID=UPI0039F6F148